jgi:hypothetical protein
MSPGAESLKAKVHPKYIDGVLDNVSSFHFLKPSLAAAIDDHDDNRSLFILPRNQIIIFCAFL